MAVINRVLSEKFLEAFTKDFKNLLKVVRSSHGELDLAIRENYLNLYYKGNSVARISPKASGEYQVEIHEKFFEGTRADDEEFFKDKKKSGKYVQVMLDEEKTPRRFLQKVHIDQFCSRVNQVNYGEEIVFEQALITDNMDREDLILIDRQVSDHVMGKRIDLLALQQVNPGQNRYRFVVLEVKLGKNPELGEQVAGQLHGYQEHIKAHIDDYIRCYQKQYAQKKALGMFGDIPFEAIEIDRQVDGLVVVGGYSRMAKSSIDGLLEKYPGIKVKKFSYKLY